jgi:hypothetical protein
LLLAGSLTLLTGPVSGQAALHGILAKIRDLNLPLVSIQPVELRRQISLYRTAGRRAGAEGVCTI